MARRSRPTVSKRQKEMARQQKQQAKLARRLESRRQKGTTEPPAGEDAQIAEINPGPQPVPDWVREDRGPGRE